MSRRGIFSLAAAVMIGAMGGAGPEPERADGEEVSTVDEDSMTVHPGTRVVFVVRRSGRSHYKPRRQRPERRRRVDMAIGRLVELSSERFHRGRLSRSIRTQMTTFMRRHLRCICGHAGCFSPTCPDCPRHEEIAQ